MEALCPSPTPAHAGCKFPSGHAQRKLLLCDLSPSPCLYRLTNRQVYMAKALLPSAPNQRNQYHTSNPVPPTHSSHLLRDATSSRAVAKMLEQEQSAVRDCSESRDERCEQP